METEICQLAWPSSRIAMLFTSTSYQSVRCSASEKETVSLTLALWVRHVTSLLRETEITPVSLLCLLEQYWPFPALQGSVLLSRANSALVLSCMQRLYSIPLSKGKDFPGFFSPETTGTAGIAQKLNCIWYEIASVVLLQTYYFQDLLSSLSFQCSWGTTNLTRFFLQITTLWVESTRLNFSHLQQR